MIQENQQEEQAPLITGLVSAIEKDDKNESYKCVIEHSELGEIPYHAVRSNPECADVIALIDAEPEKVEAYTPPTAEELAAEALAQAKASAAAALQVLKVEVDGLVFDANEKSQIRMGAAIQAAETLGLNTSVWKLADNSVQEITLAQLKQAQALSIVAVGEIVTGQAIT